MSRKNPQLPRMKVVRRTEKKTEIEIVTEKDDVPVLRTDEGVHDQGSVVNGLDPGTGREVEVEKNHLSWMPEWHPTIKFMSPAYPTGLNLVTCSCFLRWQVTSKMTKELENPRSGYTRTEKLETKRAKQQSPMMIPPPQKVPSHGLMEKTSMA